MNPQVQVNTKTTIRILLSIFLLTDTGYANVVGIDAQNFNATTNGLDFVTVQSSETLTPCIFNLGLFGNVARNTLPLFNREQDTGDIKHTDSVTGVDLNVGVGLAKNWDLGLSLPQIAAQSVKSDSYRGEFDSKGNTEVRINTKYRLWGQKGFGFAVIGTISVNRLQNNPYAGTNPGPTKTLEFAADTKLKRIAFGVNIGHRWRSPGQAIPEFPIEPFRNQYIYSAAASYHIPSINTKAIIEFFGSSPVKKVNSAFDRSQSSAEGLLGLKHDLTKHVALHIGAGRGLVHGAGSPDARIYGGINATFGPICHEEKSAIPVAVKNKKQPSLPKLEYITFDNVMFAFDSFREVLPGTKDELKGLVDYLLLPPKYKLLTIEGHTDYMGSDEYNRVLSENRAATIRKYLIEVHKLDPNSIKYAGFGSTRPVADNGNYQGRQKNRRVEFKIQR